MNSNNADAKTFLIRNYFILFLGTVAATAVLGVVISTFQMRSVHELYLERLNKVVFLHKNEFLNEIALEDSVALKQHLEIIRSELVIDAVTLQTKNLAFTSVEPKKQSPDLGVLLSNLMFFRLIGVKALAIPVTNDFDSINAVLTIDYKRSFAEWVLGPFLKFSFSIFIFALLPVGLIFVGLFRKIDRLLLSPLREVTTSFQNPTSTSLSGITENALGEIKALAVASEKLRSAERSMAFSELAGQVAHDIRSPLSALDMVLKDLRDMPEDKRILVRSATQRIKDIANNLIEKNKAGKTIATQSVKSDVNQAPTVQLISSILESIVSEKRTQLRSKPGIEIECGLSEDNYGLFAAVNLREIKRIISNLINNSVEALGEKGAISLQIDSPNSKSVRIRVIDNGKGIPPEVLARLGERGMSHGKEGTESGSGLGVYHAKATVESWGGTFLIESCEAMGTTMIIVLPRAAAPTWFVEQLKVAESSKIAVLDDDVSIHQVWDGRFQTSAPSVEMIHFSSPLEFLEWASKNQADKYLVDFELLGHKETGLDVIEKLGLKQKAILVTSRFEEPQIQSRCAVLGVGLIPKGLAPLVRIVVSKPRQRVDAVVIDDDSIGVCINNGGSQDFC